jgi:hypothetical protein
LKKRLLLLAAFGIAATSQAQNLLPSICTDPLPNDTTPICPIPWYLGDYASSGLQVGDTAADFTLYDQSGNPFNLANALALGKPVLLVGGNYTCPVFRDKIPVINAVYSTYAAQVTTVVIYGVEAHPTDTSPYFGYPNLTQDNNNDGIFFPQPLTYGDRKLMVAETYANTPLLAPTYIDALCNNWWLYYGPAPNNAYLIDTNGIVFAKHDWFDNYPHDIVCDIDSLLGILTNCSSTPGNGNFSVNMLTSDTVWGVAGAQITVDMEFINSGNDDVVMGIKRMQNNLAPGWASSMCSNICYSTMTDSIVLQIDAGDTQLFHVNFFTDTVPGMSMVRLGFRNMANNNPATVKDFFCVTSLTGVEEPTAANLFVRIFPNPADETVTIEASFPVASVEFFDLFGNLVKMGVAGQQDVNSFAPGVYLVRVTGENGESATTRFVRF